MKPGLLLMLICTANICLGQTDKMPVFKSTFSKKGQPMAAQHMEMWMREVQYRGPWKDTIILNRKVDLKAFIAESNLMFTPGAWKQYARYKKTKLKIVFDPSRMVTLAENVWSGRRHKYYKAYPIIICNETDSVTIVGEEFHIPILLEALDKDKNWKPVEMDYERFCGTGVEPLCIKPREIICVLAPVYTGEFRTTLRYRLGNSFSREFTGNISPSQFKQQDIYSH